MSKQIIEGLAHGEEVVGSDWTVMVPGFSRSEFQSVVIDEAGRAYFVTALVSAQPLCETAAVTARQAAEDGASPIMAVRREHGRVVEATEPFVEPGADLQNLGSLALAKEPPK